MCSANSMGLQDLKSCPPQTYKQRVNRMKDFEKLRELASVKEKLEAHKDCKIEFEKKLTIESPKAIAFNGSELKNIHDYLELHIKKAIKNERKKQVKKLKGRLEVLNESLGIKPKK